MCAHSAMGLFCEDIRREESGQDTIIGVCPDTLAVTSVPGVIPRLCFYIRLYLDVKTKPQEIRLSLKRPDEIDDAEILIEQDVISAAFEKCKLKGHPFAGIVSRAIMSPFPIEQAGRFDLVASIDGEEQTCGSLLIEVADPQDTS